MYKNNFLFSEKSWEKIILGPQRRKDRNYFLFNYYFGTFGHAIAHIWLQLQEYEVYNSLKLSNKNNLW